MRRVKKFAMCCLAASVGTAALAQNPKSVELTLEQAVKIALDGNPTIKVADMEIERYDYIKKEIQGNLLPGVSATASYSRTIIEQKLGGMISFGGKNTFAGGATATLPLFAPSIYATLKLNHDQMLGAVESARASRITLVNEVKKAYYNILLAEQSLDVLHSSEKTVGQTVENTRQMFENGLVAEYDLLTAEVQLSNLTPTIIQTENSIAIAGMMLKMYLSLPQDVEVKVTGTLDELKREVHEGNSDLSTDISGNSDLRSLDLQEQMLNQSLKVQRTQRYPTLGAFFNYQVTGQDLNLGALQGMFAPEGTPPASSSKSKYNWQHPTNAGVQLSIPIFAGFSRINKEKQIQNTLSQLQMSRNYAEEGLNVQVRSAINNLISAREKMLANEKTVAQAQKACDISDTRYRAGAGTILELNVSQLNLTQAKLNYSQAIYDYLSSQADYDQIIGKEQ